MMATQKKTTSISTILFDLDNTLIPTRKADKLACNKLNEILREQYAVPIDSAAVICGSFLQSFRKCPDNPTMDLDTWRHLLWTQALGEQFRSFAGEIYCKWLHIRFNYLALTSEIKLMLEKLRQNYLLGLITNGTSAGQWEKIHRLGVQDYFDVTLVSGDMPWEKPNPRIFHEACQFLGVEPRQCLMVGDKLETDILGGVQAKLGGTVMVPLVPNPNISELEPSPDFIISNIIELPNILTNNPKVPGFRYKFNNKSYKKILSVPDLEDCNSNSSDGS